MHRSLLISFILIAPPATAGPLSITVLNAVYRTDLSTHARVFTQNEDGTFESTPIDGARAATGNAPIADTLPGIKPLTFATGIADPFSVFAATSAFPEGDVGSAFADARAATVLTFAPVESGIATLTLAFAGTGLYNFSSAQAQLTDLTLNATLFDFGWTCCQFQGNVPISYEAPVTALALTQVLDASHQYGLSLFSSTNANTDTQSMRVQISGLQTVPEPTTLLLIAPGLAGVWLRRRRRDARSAVEDGVPAPAVRG